MSRLEEAIIAALNTQDGTRVVSDVLHQVANALREAIGTRRLLRDDLSRERVAQLEASLERATNALRRLQPPVRPASVRITADAVRRMKQAKRRPRSKR